MREEEEKKCKKALASFCHANRMILFDLKLGVRWFSAFPAIII